MKNHSLAVYKKSRGHVFEGNLASNNGVTFYKAVLIIEYNNNLLNIFRPVWELLKNNNWLNEKSFAGSLQKISQTRISGKLGKKKLSDLL